MKTKKDKLREKARRQLGRLLNDNGHKCYYCNLPLVRGNRIKNVIYKNLVVILYIDNGFHYNLLATCEHKNPIRDGFGNEEGNLTVACRLCNQLKSANPDGIRLKYKLKIRNGFTTNMKEKEFNKFYNSYKILIPLYKWKEDYIYEFENHLYLVKKNEMYKVN